VKKSTILLLLFLGLSCAKKTENNETLQSDTIVNASDNEKANTIDKSQINHLFIANGGTLIYLKNGDVKSCAKCDSDEDPIAAVLQTKTAYQYKDFDDYLIEDKTDTIRFFEENGRIYSGWKIIKGMPITHELSVISYSKPEKNVKDITKITDTRLVVFKPEIKEFADENTPEANAYFTAMDDWGWYSAELTEAFEKRSIKTAYLKTRFVSFLIENNETITIDTQKPINNTKVFALLYQKNKRPIITYLIPGDNEDDQIKMYLGEIK